MKRRSSRMLLLLAAATLLGAVALVLVAFRDPVVSATGGGVDSADLAWTSEEVLIRRDAGTPLTPGVMVPLDLELTNPHELDMSVDSLTIAVTKVSAPNADPTHPCTPADFAVVQIPADLPMTLPAHATRTLSDLGIPSKSLPSTGMLNRPVNQDGCKDSSVTLAYTLTGREGTR